MADKTKKETNAPNIQYVGKRQKFDKMKLKAVTVAKQVPAFIMDGKEKIKLPEGIENGIFMSPEIVARLFVLRPDDFRTPVLKSAKPATKKTTPAAKTVDTSKIEPKTEVNK